MISEKEFEDILCKYPELIEDGLEFKGRQIHLYGRRMDIIFEDKFNRILIIELKIGPIKDEHIGQILSYEGILLSAENPTIRVMLIGNRVPPNIRFSLDHHGVAWKEISISYLKDYLIQKHDSESIKLFDRQDSIEDSNNQNHTKIWKSDLVPNINFNKSDLLLKKSKHQTVWDDQFRNLVKYRIQNPNSWPKQLEEFPEGNKLGLWCLTQRIAYKQGRLSEERIKLLSDIAFILVVFPHQDSWNKQYENLIQFRKDFPDRWPHSNEEYPEGNNLGSWISRQKFLYNKAKMLPENFEKLNQIGLDFEDLNLGKSNADKKSISHAEHAQSQLELFFKEHIQVCVEEDVFIEKGEIYRKYKQWAEKNNYYPFNLAQFSRHVYLKYCSVTPKQARMVYSHKPNKRIWRNLKYVNFES